jgi:hypothetical protein
MFASMREAVSGVHAHVKDLHGDLLRVEAAGTTEAAADGAAGPAGAPTGTAGA